MFGNLTGLHLIVVLVVIILLFGAPKLPALARSLGQSMRILKGEMKSLKDDDKDHPEPSHNQDPHPKL
jgi:sec-independent protein translocase protein TatA